MLWVFVVDKQVICSMTYSNKTLDGIDVVMCAYIVITHLAKRYCVFVSNPLNNENVNCEF